MNKKLYLIFLFLLIIPFSVSAVENLTNAVSQNWDFNENIGTKAVNSVDKTKNATLSTDALWTSTGFNGSGIFQSSATGKTITVPATVSGIYSFKYWYKPNKTTSGYHIMSDTSTERGSIGLNSNGNIFVRSPNNIEIKSSNNQLVNDSWQMIVYTVNGSGAGKIYVNGTETGYTATGTQDSFWYGGTVLYITNYRTGILPTQGSFDELTMFNETLNATDVMNIFNNESQGCFYPNWNCGATVTYRNYSLKAQVNMNGVGVLANLEILDNSTNTTMLNMTNSSSGFTHYYGYNSASPLTSTYYIITAYQGSNTSRRPIGHWVEFNSYN